MGRRWTSQEDEILRLNAYKMNDEAIGNLLGRTATAVEKRKWKFGIRGQCRGLYQYDSSDTTGEGAMTAPLAGEPITAVRRCFQLSAVLCGVLACFCGYEV